MTLSPGYRSSGWKRQGDRLINNHIRISMLALLALMLTACESTDLAGATTSTGANVVTTRTPTTEATSTTSTAESDAAGLVEAAWGAFGQDVDTYRKLISDEAILFGQRRDTEAGTASFEFLTERAAALDTRFTEFDCVDTGEVDTQTDGVIVRCEGLFSDGRFESFETPPLPATGIYAVRQSMIVNAISFESPPAPWFEFFIRYLEETYPDQMDAACDGPDASGETCGSLQLEMSEEIASAWKAQEDGADT